MVVLPFDDLSDQGDLGPMVDGFTEDLTTLLARMPGYFVIARNTAFTYRGSGAGRDVRAIGQELQVRYALEGSVRPMGDQTRVTAQLIDATTGTHLWADKFDRPSTDLHKTLDQLTAEICLQLGGELTRAEANLAEQRSPGDQNAWDLYQRAKSIPMTQGWSTESFAKISDLLRQSINLEPDYAPSHAYLSLMLAIGHWVKLVERPQEATTTPCITAKRR